MLESGAFETFHSLEKLAITRSNISNIDESVFGEAAASKITELNFHGNNISFIAGTVFSRFGKLSSLNLAMNPLNLGKMMFPAELDNLVTLNLGYCNLTYIPDHILGNLM